MNNLKYNKLNKTSSYIFLSLLSIGAVGLFFISKQTSATVFRFKVPVTPNAPSSTSPLTETYLGATVNDPCGSSNRLISNRKKYPRNAKCLKITKGS